jgi:uncharacterized protein (TIGR02147 family)
MSILEHENYRTYLRNVMAEKASRNSRFSLRAMAKTLGVAPSFLSTVLKGDKNISFEMAANIAKKLGLNKNETVYFCLLVQKDSAKNPEVRESLLGRIRDANPDLQINDLSVEHFKIISNPLHFSILSATALSDFQATARNLAVALGEPQANVELALERLEMLEMIEKNDDGFYRKIKANPRVVSQAPNQALRKFHKETLGKAIESLETQSPQEKVIGSETFTIGEDQIEDFRKLADEFFDRALALAKKSKRQDYVYHLGLQFFNLTSPLKTLKRRNRK